MTVYIENVIADNFVITYMIASLTYRVCGIGVKKIRCAVAATVSTITAIVYPFIKNVWLTLAVKIILYVVLCGILYFGKKKKFLPIAFLGITILLGGIMFAICFCLSDFIGMFYDSIYDFSPGIIIAVAWLLFKIVKKLRDKFVKRRDATNGICEMTIQIKNKRKKLNAFMDTGNRVYDEKSGLPVIIIKLTSIAEFFDENELLSFVSGTADKSKYYVGNTKIKGIGGKPVKIALVKPDKIFLTVDKVEKTIEGDVLLGIVNFTFADSAEYDAVLHPAMILGGGL